MPWRTYSSVGLDQSTLIAELLTFHWTVVASPLTSKVTGKSFVDGVNDAIGAVRVTIGWKLV